jgi:hypothetical protein
MVPLTRLGSLLLACAVAGCTPLFQEEGTYEETFPLDGISRIEIRGVGGAVPLRAAAGGEFTARGTGFATGADRAAALENLGHARLTARFAGETLIAAFDPPLELEGIVELDLDRVSDVPAGIEVVLHAPGGGLRVLAVEN